MSDTSAEITRHLTALRNQGFLQGDDRRRWTTDRLAGFAQQSGDLFLQDSPDLGSDSPDLAPSSSDSPAKWEELLDQAKPVRQKGRAPRAEVEAMILQLCANYFLTLKQIAELLNRKPATVQEGYLTPMVRDGKLILRFPKQANHPRQAYSVPNEQS